MFLREIVTCHKSRSDEFTLYPIGDIHIGAEGCDVAELKKTVEAVRADKNARWIGMGDYAEHITMTDKRFDLKTIAKKYRDHLDDLPWICVQDLLEIFKPIKDKCLGLVVGNHEEKLRLNHSNDVHARMCALLGAENLGYASITRWTFKRGNQPDSPGSVIKIFATHSTVASRKPGGKINRMDDMASQYNCDIALFGHGHSKLIASRIEFDIPNHGKMPNKPTVRKKVFVMTGCYRFNHTVGTLDYAEKAGFPPVEIGSPRILIRPWAPDPLDRIHAS